ncbi:MAG: hypothetical protein RMK29_11530 [Myxococcales bacterium]|nr:hypothetical protein [Myxococcales bacterium]
MQDVEQEETGFDPETRVLCADEACIGVVGEDGRCRLCGRPGAAAGVEGDPAWAAGMGEEQVEGEEQVDFANRRLCADEACIGVVGEDGRCRLCGRPGAGDG